MEGTDHQVTEVSNRPNSRRHILRIKIFLVLVVLVGSITGLYLWINRPALTIGSTKISMELYDLLNAQAEASKLPGANDMTEQQSVKDVLIEAEKHKLVAKELNLTVSDDDVLLAARVKYNLTEDKPVNEWQKLSAYMNAFDESAYRAQFAEYRAGIYYFGFGRFVDTTEIVPANPNFGNAQKIAEDRTYAEQKANEYRKKLEDKSITPEQAINEILLDGRLGFGSFGNRSRVVTVDKYGAIPGLGGINTGERLPSKEFNSIKSLSPGGIGKLETVNARLTYKPTNAPRSNGDLGFYFVNLEEKLTPDPILNSRIENRLKEIRVQSRV